MPVFFCLLTAQKSDEGVPAFRKKRSHDWLG
jgi:hypothetical protein